MPLTASATARVAATPQQVLELVLDLDRYRQLDPKIVRVGSVEGPDDEGRGSVELWGRLRGLPPAPDRQEFQLVRWSSLTFTGARRQPARLVFDFTGTVTCEPDDGSTVVTHAYEFGFKGPFRLVERFLAGWLQDQIEDEVRQLAAAFGPTGRGSSPVIRSYAPDDLDAVLDVWYRASLLAHSFLTEEFLAAERQEIAERWMPMAETAVYELDGTIVGFVALVGNEVGAIFVDPDHHGQGIGRALMDDARSRRPFLELDVFEANEIGRRFYDAYGFRFVDRHVHEATGQTELRLRLD